MEQWHVICGKFLAINITNMSCACPRSSKGLSPSAHLGDGSLDLILIRKCSRFNFLRFLLRHTNQWDQVSGQVDRWAVRGAPRVAWSPHLGVHYVVPGKEGGQIRGSAFHHF